MPKSQKIGIDGKRVPTKRGRPKAVDPTEGANISLPRSILVRLFDGRSPKDISKDEEADPSLGEYFKFFADRAAREGFSGTRSGIVQLALEELWRRRHEPSAIDAMKLVKYGVRSVVDDIFAEASPHAVATADDLIIQTGDLHQFTTRKGILAALTSRIQKGHGTRLIVRAYPIKGALHLRDSDMVALNSLLSGVGVARLKTILTEDAARCGDDPMRQRAKLSIICRYNPKGAPFEEIFWTETHCLVAPSYEVTGASSAIKYVPSAQPEPFEGWTRVKVGERIQPVRARLPSSDFHSQLPVNLFWQLSIGNAGDNTERIVNGFIKRHPEDSPQPTP